MTKLPPSDIARDLHATLAARRDVGLAYDEPFLESLVEKLVAHMQPAPRQPSALVRGAAGCQRTALALISLVLAIPLVAISAGFAGWAGVLVVAVMLVGVNVAARG